nr:lipolytic enzyme [uncultured bacterium]
MPLDAKASAFLDQMATMNLPTFDSMTPEAAREAYLALRAAASGDAVDVGAVKDQSIPGPAGEIPVRIYTPEGPGPFPLLVYYHGGGWVIGDIETHDGLCRSLTNAAQCVTVSVDYRLAPEHKFPAAIDDAYAAAEWVAANAPALGGRAAPIAVGGDSAGGNLAAAVTLIARDRGTPSIGYQLLFYPVLDFASDTASYADNGEGYLLTKNTMRWFWNHYLKRESDGENPHASPLRAEDLRGLPPGLVITAEFDPLRDEGEAYAARLREAGVAVTTKRYAGMIHAFMNMPAILGQAKMAFDEAGAALRAALAE